MHSSYPVLLGSTQSFRPDFNMADDDVLSYTSTEFEGNEPVLPSVGAFPRDVLLNMNLSGLFSCLFPKNIFYLLNSRLEMALCSRLDIKHL